MCIPVCLPGLCCTCPVPLLHHPQTCAQWISDPLHHCLGYRSAPPFQGQAQQSLLPCTAGERTRWTVYASNVPQQQMVQSHCSVLSTRHIFASESQGTFHTEVVKHWLHFLGSMHTLYMYIMHFKCTQVWLHHLANCIPMECGSLALFTRPSPLWKWVGSVRLEGVQCTCNSVAVK